MNLLLITAILLAPVTFHEGKQIIPREMYEPDETEPVYTPPSSPPILTPEPEPVVLSSRWQELEEWVQTRTGSTFPNEVIEFFGETHSVEDITWLNEDWASNPAKNGWISSMESENHTNFEWDGERVFENSAYPSIVKVMKPFPCVETNLESEGFISAIGKFGLGTNRYDLAGFVIQISEESFLNILVDRYRDDFRLGGTFNSIPLDESPGLSLRLSSNEQFYLGYVLSNTKIMIFAYTIDDGLWHTWEYSSEEPLSISLSPIRMGLLLRYQNTFSEELLFGYLNTGRLSLEEIALTGSYSGNEVTPNFLYDSCESLAEEGDELFSTGDFEGAREMYQNCVDTYDLYGEGSAEYAARSSFQIGEIVRLNYDIIVASTETVQQKVQLKSEIENWYGKSIMYSVDIWFMASCVRTGELYEDFANSVAFMDPPPGLCDSATDVFYNQLYIQFYEPEIQKAISIYEVAIEKAVSADISNKWVRRAATNLERLYPGRVASIGL